MFRTHLHQTLQLTLVFLLAAVLFSCSKKEETGFFGKSRDYLLYDTVLGKAREAGKFTIAELQNKGAKLTIQLNATALVAGMALKANIVTKDTLGAEIIYSKLADVNATTGVSETAKLVTDSAKNISYADIILSKGYFVKIFSGSSVKASGAIQ
jgi:hypothetical protein